MENINQLIKSCKCSVTIQVNNHKDYYQTVEEYIKEIEQIDDIDKDVYNEMIKRNTIVEIQAYPDTPVGSYVIYHYDINEAIEVMLSMIN